MSPKALTILMIVGLVVILLAGGAGIYYLTFVVRAEAMKERDGAEAKLKEFRLQVHEIKCACAGKDLKDGPSSLKDSHKSPGLEARIVELRKIEAEKLQSIPNLDRMEYDTFVNLLDDLRRRSGVFVPKAQWVTKDDKRGKGKGKKGVAAAAGTPEKIHRVQYDLSVQGGFYQLLRFVNLLEQQKRFINVDSFSIVPARRSGSVAGGAPTREMKVSIYSFTYRQGQGSAAKNSEASRLGTTTPLPQ